MRWSSRPFDPFRSCRYGATNPAEYHADRTGVLGLLLGLGSFAAAAGGYVAHKEGYRVRNPVTKSGDSEKKETDKE